MNAERRILPACAMLMFALMTACGDNPSSAYPDASTVTCGVTEAYAADYLMAVIGKDAVPTRIDAVNSGSCEFDGYITAVRVQLSGRGSQTTVVDLAAPARVLSAPFDGIADLPPIDPDLPAGRYARAVTALTSGGREIDVPIFEDVLLVREPGSVQAELLRHQGRWERSGVTNYVYTGAWNCFCERSYTAFAEVTVRNGAVAGVDSADPAVPVIPDPQRFVPIRALFEQLQSAMDEDAYRISVAFNEQYGYPEQFFIDYNENLADEERGFVIRSLALD